MRAQDLAHEEAGRGEGRDMSRRSEGGNVKEGEMQRQNKETVKATNPAPLYSNQLTVL